MALITATETFFSVVVSCWNAPSSFSDPSLLKRIGPTSGYFTFIPGWSSLRSFVLGRSGTSSSPMGIATSIFVLTSFSLSLAGELTVLLLSLTEELTSLLVSLTEELTSLVLSLTEELVEEDEKFDFGCSGTIVVLFRTLKTVSLRAKEETCSSESQKNCYQKNITSYCSALTSYCSAFIAEHRPMDCT